MASCPTTENTKSAKEVFKEFVEKSITTENSTEKNINVKRKGEAELSSFGLLRMMSSFGT